MKQIFMGGHESHNTATGYYLIDGFRDWQTAIIQKEFPVAAAGTLSHLRVDVGTAPGGVTSRTYTVMKNNVATALTVTISGAATTAEMSTNPIHFAFGERVALRATLTGAPAASTVFFSSQYECDDPQTAIWGGNSGLTLIAATRYDLFGVPGVGWATLELDRQTLWGVPGTIKTFIVDLNIDPGDPGDSYSFTIMKNGAAEASSSVTIADPDLVASVTGLSIATAAGNVFSIRSTAGGSPVAARGRFGVAYQPDTDGEFNYSGFSSSPSPTVVNYTAINSSFGYSATESNRFTLGSAATGALIGYELVNLMVQAQVAPGATRARTLTVRQNLAATPVTVTLSNLNTVASATGSTVIDYGDLLTIEHTPTNSPVSSLLTWTFAFRLVSENDAYAFIT